MTYIQKIIRRILLHIGFKLAKDENKKQYPQLWWYNAKLKEKSKRLALLLQWLCGKLVGHEFSETEHGYNGGRFVNQWCRWCNKIFSIPIEESTWAEKNMI